MNTLIDLIRHGEPEGGSAYRGYTVDDPLSDKGWQQMWTAVGEATPWRHIVSSPMRRCREFAEQLAVREGLSVQVDDGFKEIGFGSWEGRTRAQIKATDLQEYEAFYCDPVNCRPPGAEPLDEFIDRVSSAYESALTNAAGQHTLIVAHAGVIRAVIAHVLQAPPAGLYRMRIANAGLVRIHHGKYAPVLEFMNGVLE